MSPRLMLSLWRERWGKAGDSTSKRPYLDGSVNRWSDRLMAAQIWSLPGFLNVAVVLSLLGLPLVMMAHLSLNSQIVFAVLVATISLYARRFGGPWVTLVLVGLSLIASARYLFWRFDATLSPYLDTALVLGFVLCAGELHMWILRLVDLLAGAFPLRRGPVPLPADPGAWPTVDVFILCHGLTSASIERAAVAVNALDWPSQKIKRYLLDDSPTAATQQLADSLGLAYLSTPANDGGRCGSINQALPATHGEWVVVVDGDRTPDKHFLTRVAGWGVADSTLAMMQTAGHFLVPAPSGRSLAVMQEPDLGGSCAMIRRSTLTRAGGLAVEPVTAKTHTALKLHALGFRCASIGFEKLPAQNTEPSPQVPSGVQPPSPAVDVFRVDHPFSDTILYGKQRLGALQAMLHFYRLVPLLIFFTAPLAYLLAEVNLIQTSAPLLLAYFIPHWLHGYIMQARLEGSTRHTVLEEIKELALGLCILFATAFSVTRTACSRWLKGFTQCENRPTINAVDRLIVWPYAVVLILNLVGFTNGIAQSALSAEDGHDMAMLYSAWAGYNLLLLVALLAVSQESEHIRQHAHRQTRRPATVRLTSGHALSCVTGNFPDPALILELPDPLVLGHGDRVNVSIFRHEREFVFPAQVVSCEGTTLCVNIEEAVQTAYRALGAAAFSRGPDWPKWLPGRSADQPFPPWMIKAFDAVRVAALDVKKRLGEFSWWLLVGSWTQGWKKK